MGQVIYAANQPPSFLANWASRAAFFCLALLLAAAFLHRISLVATPLAINIVVSAFGGALVALAMALIAGLDVWITGRQGAARIVVAVAVSLALLAMPAALWRAAQDWPQINDVTTDFESPPPLDAGSGGRPADANPLAYPGAGFRRLQAEHYPDIRPLRIARTVDDAFDIVVQALGKLRYRDFQQIRPADDGSAPGYVIFTDTTIVFGFTDDVVIRVQPDGYGARIDLRSASRYGLNDFGQNAARIRTLLNAIAGRLEATVPAPRPAAEDAPPPNRRDARPSQERNRARENRRQ